MHKSSYSCVDLSADLWEPKVTHRSLDTFVKLIFRLRSCDTLRLKSCAYCCDRCAQYVSAPCARVRQRILRPVGKTKQKKAHSKIVWKKNYTTSIVWGNTVNFSRRYTCQRARRSFDTTYKSERHGEKPPPPSVMCVLCPLSVVLPNAKLSANLSRGTARSEKVKCH